jgi:hypothetical protein
MIGKLVRLTAFAGLFLCVVFTTAHASLASDIAIEWQKENGNFNHVVGMMSVDINPNEGGTLSTTTYRFKARDEIEISARTYEITQLAKTRDGYFSVTCKSDSGATYLGLIDLTDANYPRVKLIARDPLPNESQIVTNISGAGRKFRKKFIPGFNLGLGTYR